MRAIPVPSMRPSFGGRSREALEAEREALRDYVGQLERLVYAADWTPPTEWRLTQMHARMFGLLLTRGLVSRPQFASALWSLRPDCGLPGEAAIDMHLCRMRRRLKPFGIRVDGVRDQGWRLTGELVARLRAEAAELRRRA